MIPRRDSDAGLNFERLIEPLTTSLLVPLFFVYAGLNTQLALVNSLWLWTMTGLVFVVACAVTLFA